MAGGTVVVYANAFKQVQQQSYNFASFTMVVHLVSHGYTPNPGSHSDFVTDITQELTTSGYASRVLQNVVISQPSNSHIRFDADDITLSALATMTAKYAVVELQTSHDLLCYVDLETGTTSGIDATQVIVQWGAAGIFQVNIPN